MAGTIAQYQQGVFATPINGTVADASVVLGNDNNLRGKYNSHDGDASIHVQSSTLAARPVAGVTQRVWITTDGLRAYLDSGAAWGEIAYLPLVGGTVTGGVTITTGGLTVSAGTLTVSAAGNVSSIVSASTVLLLDNTLAAASFRINIDGRRGGTTRWGIGSDASDQFAVTNAALNAANLTITDAGAVTIRSALTAVAGTFTGVMTITPNLGLTFSGGNDAGLFIGATNTVYIGDYAGATKGLRINFSTGLVTVTTGLTLTTGSLTFGTAVSKIVPGATSISHRNNADSADNLLITDTGAVTIRSNLTVSSGTHTITGNLFVTGQVKGTSGIGFLSANASATADTISLSHTGTTTGAISISLPNTGGGTLFGTESSVGGSLLGASTAYSTVLGTTTAVPLILFTNSIRAITVSSLGNTTVHGTFTHGDTLLLITINALSNAAGAATATLTNAPSAGNPTKWITVNDAGTLRRIPAW